MKKIELLLITLGMCFLFLSEINAQNIVIENRWKEAHFISMKGPNNFSRSTHTALQLKVEKVDNTWFRLTNSGRALCFEGEKLSLREFKPGWWSAQWKKIPTQNGYFRLQCRMKQGIYYLHMQNGVVECSKLGDMGWWSAQWKFKEKEEKKGEVQDNDPTVILKSNNNNLMGRCNDCYPGADNLNSATVHISYDKNNISRYAKFKLRKMSNGKYTLQADNGDYVGRCQGCIPSSPKLNSLMIHLSESNAAYAQFSLVKIKDNTYALEADSGMYVRRCNGCVKGELKSNSALVDVPLTNVKSGTSAHWEIIDVNTKKGVNLDVITIDEKLNDHRKAKTVTSFTFKNGRTFYKIADRVWVEKSPLGKDYVGIYEELEIVSGKIRLHDYDKGKGYELNIAEKRLESNGKPLPGKVKEIKSDNLTFKELYRVKFLERTLFAYNTKCPYGGTYPKCYTPSCSEGTDEYKLAFFAACEEHDRAQRAPWKAAGYTDVNGDIHKNAKAFTDMIFYSRMMKMCGNTASIFSDGVCKEIVKRIPNGVDLAGIDIKDGMNDAPNFWDDQKSEEDNASENETEVVYSMPGYARNKLVEEVNALNSNFLKRGDNYKIEIDFSGEPSNSDSETSSLITVEFFDKYDLSLGTESSWGVEGNGFLIANKKQMSIYTTRTPAYFVISTIGDDAFFMDYVELHKNDDLLVTYGRSGGSGYCLSTDSGDSFNIDGKIVKCHKGFKFNVSSEKVFTTSNKKWTFSQDIDPLD